MSYMDVSLKRRSIWLFEIGQIAYCINFLYPGKTERYPRKVRKFPRSQRRTCHTSLWSRWMLVVTSALGVFWIETFHPRSKIIPVKTTSSAVFTIRRPMTSCVYASANSCSRRIEARMKSVRAERHQHPPSATKCTSRELFHWHMSKVIIDSQGVITRESRRSGGISALSGILVSHEFYSKW